MRIIFPFAKRSKADKGEKENKNSGGREFSNPQREKLFISKLEPSNKPVSPGPHMKRAETKGRKKEKKERWSTGHIKRKEDVKTNKRL